MTILTHPLPAQSHRRLVIRLLLVIAAFFAFGFALVPLYDALCLATGLNGKTAGKPTVGVGGIVRTATSLPSRIDSGRTVTVEFTGTVMPGLPWNMQALTASLDLHPGELHQALFRVHNHSDKPIVGQAVPSVTPGIAAQNFEKLDCFCFAQQALAPGETKDLPVTFIVKPELDKDVRTITLAYAFFNAVAPTSSAKTLASR